MEDLLLDKDQWITVDLDTKPMGVSDEERKKLDQKAKSTIRLCVLDSVLLNVSGEATKKALWDKLGTLYQSKSLVNKLFLRKKLYNLGMKDGDSVIKHLNAFNTMVVCWKCGKEGHYKRDYKSKGPDKGKGSDDAPYAEVKTTSDEGGDVYLASSNTHVDHEAWLIDSGVKIVFEKDTCNMVRGALVLMQGVQIGTLYKLQGNIVVDGCNSSMVPETGGENLVVSGEKTMLWHQKLEHIGEKGLRILHVKEFKALVENQTKKKIKVLRTDNSGEFCNMEFEEFCKKCRIARQKTTPYKPEQNGDAERMNKTFM
eukprot:PITA_25271